MVTLSFIDAEYVALTEAAKEALWLKGLMKELGYEQKVVTINCDNQSAIYLCKNQVFHERSKHIDVRLYFIRNLVESKSIAVNKIAGAYNPADMFTKSVTAEKHRLCMSLLQVL